MIKLPIQNHVRRIWNKLLRKPWLIPVLFSFPYFLSLLWLISLGQVWIAFVLLSPLAMGLIMAVVTLWLAHQEFR